MIEIKKENQIIKNTIIIKYVSWVEMNVVVVLTAKWIKCGLTGNGAKEVWFMFPDDSLCEHGKVALCFCVLICNMEMRILPTSL